MRIGVIKEKKAGLFITSIIFAICFIVPFLTSIDLKSKIVILIIFVSVYLILLISFAISMEWYVLDEESVIVKNIFGIVNKVYYKDVKSTRIKRIPIFTRDKGIHCLLLNDGRKESSLFRGCNVDNHKKYMVRIPYTQEVVDFFVINNIKFNDNLIYKTLIE